MIGRQSHVSPAILRLARWMGEYYCCGPEAALRTVLPEAVRKEKDGWRVSDIGYGGSWEYANKGRLGATVRQAIADSGN